MAPPVSLARAQLQHLAQKHEHGDDSSGFEIDRDRAAHAAESRQETFPAQGRDEAVRSAAPCAHGDQREHVQIAVRTDATPRTKNGHPAHSTTGVASSNCSQFDVCAQANGQAGEVATHFQNEDRQRQNDPTQNRRRMSASSRFSP